MARLHVITGAGDHATALPIRRIGLADLKDALARGLDDFLAMPSHAVFLCLLYPVVGLLIFRLALGANVLPLLYPIAAGFALLGPFAALGLYEMSRRREAGLDVSWKRSLDVFRSPSIDAIAVLGLMLVAIFLVWVAVAQSIYVAYFGYKPAAAMSGFFHQVLTTPEGWGLIVVGNFVGFLFAVLVLSISAISFPLLLDRDVGAGTAVLTSIRVVLANPFPMAIWGLTVAVLLAIGSLPALFGLAVVLPVLGHATWHLYRKVVEPDHSDRPRFRDPSNRPRRPAAEFPASLFPSRWSDSPRI
jgi:uncharacterized membrane protein